MNRLKVPFRLAERTFRNLTQKTMRTKLVKRQYYGGEFPLGIQMRKTRYTEHRRYPKITDNYKDGGLSMNFSMKVSNYVLQQSLVSKNDAKNLICSPLSMEVALKIVALGARGLTLAQLLEVFGCNGLKEVEVALPMLFGAVKESKDVKKPEIEISFVNGIWLDQRISLNASFQKVVSSMYKTQFRNVDFANKIEEVTKEVDSWAKKESKGFYKEIISEGALSRDINLLLVNVLYFKGTWVKKFDPEYTKDLDFYLLNGDKLKVPFMNKYQEYFDYGMLEGCQVLRMLYNEDERARSFSMYIFLPEEKDGLPNMLEKIQLDSSSFFIDKLKLKNKKIDKLSIPKFDFKCELPLSEAMQKLGLTLLFDMQRSDLTGIVDEGVYVSDILQKGRVQVDEQGTKAVVMMYGGYGSAAPPPPSPPTNFVANHPFLFIIREDFSGAILFIGTMLNPSLS